MNYLTFCFILYCGYCVVFVYMIVKLGGNSCENVISVLNLPII
jgi:hypothetical protein